MKIVFFINDISCSGGSERAASVIANSLVASGMEVNVLAWMGGKDSFFYLDPKIKIHSLYEEKVNIYKSYLPSFLKYHKVLKEIKPDVVIDVCTALTIFSAPLRIFRNYKLVSWEHFNTSVNWNPITPRLSRWLAAKFATKTIVLTQRDKENYSNYYHAKNVVCIPNPITISHSKQADLSSKVVLAIGRFTNQKGFDRLVEAWRIVAREKNDWKLKIIGDGELRDTISAQIKALGLNQTIELHLPTKNIEEHYLKASIYAMSSRFEGLPLVLIEAKSYGLPTISFDCETGPREIIRHQLDGLLVENGNIELLAQGILLLINNEDLRINYGNEALQDLDRFNSERIRKQWLNLLKSL